MKTQTTYEYKNIEQNMTPNGCVTRKVVIYKNGKGYKSVTTHCPPKSHTVSKNRTRKNKTVKRFLSESEVKDIQQKRFIRGLFNDCQ